MSTSIKRRFILGDEWLYYKIYSGPKTLEDILVNEINGLTKSLTNDGVIDYFFFIRYTDPEYHLRLRFHIVDISLIHILIKGVNDCLKKYIDSRLVWKVSTDTYNRELERYGASTITKIEKLFSYNSVSIINFLSEERDSADLDIRWQWGIKYIDIFLSRFGFNLESKINFFHTLNDGYSKEFSINKEMRILLDKKYRNESTTLFEILDKPRKSSMIGYDIIQESINIATPIINELLELYAKNSPNIPLNNLLGSIIHMHFNRLFSSKQRMHELVLYYFMHKYNKSKAARIKFSSSTL